MATVNFSNQYVTYANAANIPTVGASSFNTSALPKNGGEGQLNVYFGPQLIEYGKVNSVVVNYTAYGTRTGVLGSKAIIRVCYWDYDSSGWVQASSHGDVGRGSSNATSYKDTIYPSYLSEQGFQLCFKIINPIATQTNQIYVSNISFTINCTAGSFTITTAVSPPGSGSVSGGGSYNYGSTATLTATPSSGYKFVKWSDNNTSNPRSVTVTVAATYTAYFELDKINNIYVNTVQPKSIYYNANTIVFVVDGTIPTVGASEFDTVDGFHIKVQNTVPSGMTEVKEVYVDLKKYYG